MKIDTVKVLLWLFIGLITYLIWYAIIGINKMYLSDFINRCGL